MYILAPLKLVIGAAPLIITIDGPSGAGKSTIGQEVAKKLGYLFLDTGATYRACALFMLENGIPVDVERAVSPMLQEVDIDLKNAHVFLNGKDVTKKIRTPEIDQAASKISQLPSVRRKLTYLQRKIAADNNVVAEGRDMGTVVFPSADLKIFLTASPEERARRRKRQLDEEGNIISYDIILHQIKKRDKADSEREIAPLKPAEDSIIIDSTNLSAEEVVEEIIKLAKEQEKKMNKKNEATGFSFSVDNCLGFIANRLVKAFLKLLDHKLEDFNLTGAQFCVLTKLFEEEGLTQTQLAQRLYIESPTLVRTLDRLEEAGLIERRRVPSDRRAFHIFLTQAGRDMEDILMQKGKEVHEISIRGMSEKEIEKLKDLLFHLWQNLENGARELKSPDKK